MNLTPLHQFGTDLLAKFKIDAKKKDKDFSQRFFTHLDAIENLFDEVYAWHPKRNEQFETLDYDIIINNESHLDIAVDSLLYCV